MNLFSKSLRFKAIFFSLLALTIVTALFFAAIYLTSYKIVEDELGRNAQSIAVTAAHIVMSDTASYREFLQTGDTQSDYYKKMQAIFNDIKANSEIKFIYTQIRLNEDTTRYILDSELPGMAEYSPPGSLDHNDLIREKVYQTQKPAHYKLAYYPGWGMYIVAFAPLFDENEEFLGLLGIDVESKQLPKHLTHLVIATIITYLCLVGALVFLLLKFSKYIIDPLVKDKLTGAYSNRFFDNFLNTEIEAAVKYQRPLSILMVDIDNFKQINDTYGHIPADSILSGLSETILRMLRKSDYLVRYGGDEFVILLTATPENGAVLVAERIRNAVTNLSLPNKEELANIKVSVSIGVCALDSVVPANAKEFLKRADEAMYKAKRERNKVCVYGPC